MNGHLSYRLDPAMSAPASMRLITCCSPAILSTCLSVVSVVSVVSVGCALCVVPCLCLVSVFLGRLPCAASAVCGVCRVRRRCALHSDSGCRSVLTLGVRWRARVLGARDCVCQRTGDVPAGGARAC